ncbi:3'-5'-exoribonuclease [Tieghemiomyces parasiticus]|uniref:3'-5'-exoribonuclease n=1 Tax=Tieghemiomyces parasiticus TaxID=78921 RepID=A0A9W7ZJU2_9FUNG|nr:3'-5'-exoribonuclease [Tieghemiomyces parasiticus]
MVREVEPSLNEKTFLLQALHQGLRLDGRSPVERRELEAEVNPQDLGVVTVRLGQTKVTASVSCEIVRPFPDRPTEGLLVIASEFGTMASPAFDGQRSDEEVFIARHVDKTLRRSRCIDLEGLCIVAGEKVWSIRVDLHFLDHDGSLLDAACFAAISALTHFRRPDVSVIGEEVTVHSIEERNPVPLGIHHYPICITFAFFELREATLNNTSGGEGGSGGAATAADPTAEVIQQLCVVDPTLLEEQACKGRMSVSINSHHEICAISKAGGMPLDHDLIIECSKHALKMARPLITKAKSFATSATAKKATK